MKQNNKLKLDTPMMEVYMIMSEGNPGALTVLMEMTSKGGQIDPDCGHPMLAIFSLDAKGIYGSKIWVLYKDVCGKSIENMLALLRHVQLGMSTEEEIFMPKDMDVVMKDVQERLPKFNKKGGVS